MQFGNSFSHSIGCLFIESFFCYAVAFGFDLALLIKFAFLFLAISKKSMPKYQRVSSMNFF